MPRPLITLCTDFGLRDSYVGQMKGAILAIHPEAVLVDLTHAIAPRDIVQGACVLEDSIAAFPENTLHVVVVDPGVGGERRIVAVEMAGQRFVAPDNGVLSRVAQRHPPTHIVAVREPRFWRTTVSNTFHGRDIMGPVAAHWSLGHAIDEFGPPLDALIPLAWEPPRREGNDLIGTVLWSDRFGNLVTNLHVTQFANADWSELRVRIGDTELQGVHRFYSEQPCGELIALVGSSGRLEVAVVCGNAAERLGLTSGAEVRVSGLPAEPPQ